MVRKLPIINLSLATMCMISLKLY